MSDKQKRGLILLQLVKKIGCLNKKDIAEIINSLKEVNIDDIKFGEKVALGKIEQAEIGLERVIEQTINTNLYNCQLCELRTWKGKEQTIRHELFINYSTASYVVG